MLGEFVLGRRERERGLPLAGRVGGCPRVIVEDMRGVKKSANPINGWRVED